MATFEYFFEKKLILQHYPHFTLPPIVKHTVIFNRQTSDEILLRESPDKLIAKYLKVIRRVVHQFWKKLEVSESELKIIEEIVLTRLLPRLKKFQDKAEGETYALTLLVECTQVVCNDVLDLQLLRKKSPKLIVKYRSYISARMDYLVNTAYFKAHDAEDVLQWVQHKLLERLRAGRFEAFESKDDTLFRTYLYRVVQNLFTDANRSLYQTQKNRQKLELKSTLVASKKDAAANPFDKLSDEQSRSMQSRRFGQILKLFAPSNRIKFELCVKGNYYLPITKSEIHVLNIPAKEAQAMYDFFGGNYQEVSMQVVWKQLGIYISLLEGKNVHPDTLRKWFTRQRNQFIAKLLTLTMIDKEMSSPQTQEKQSKMLLQKINGNRAIAKFAVEWLGDVVYIYYQQVPRQN